MSAEACHECGASTKFVCAPDGDYGWVHCCPHHDHEDATAEAHPPAPAITPGIDTPAPPTPAKPADGRTEPQGEDA